jgi:hemolysin activation/secretion protein
LWPGLAAGAALAQGEPTAPPSAAPQAAASPPAASRAAGFFIEAFDVAGNRILDPLTVDQAVSPYLGPDRTARDIEGARAALEQQYRARGFESVVVGAAEAPDDYAIVRLEVVETRLGSVTVEGARHASEAVVRRQLDELRGGAVPDFRRVERQITEANRHFSAREVTVLPRAGTAPGTIDVAVRVKDEPAAVGSAELNNNRNRDTAPLRLTFQGGFNDLWRIGHQVSLAYSYAPENPSNSQVFSASYTLPFLGSPWSLTASGLVSTSNVALALGNQTVIGNGYTLAFRAQYELPPRTLGAEGAQSSVFRILRFGTDYKNYEQEITATIGNEVVQQFPKIGWLTIAAEFIRQQAADNWTSTANVAATAGVRAASQELIEIPNPESFRPGQPPTILVPAFQYSRSDARGNFVKLTGDLTHSHDIYRDILVVARIEGQLADGPLLPNEQYSLGGFTSVRGYLVGEAIGDNGLGGTLELRSPSFADALGGAFDEFRVFGFVDAGHVRTLRPLPGQTRHATLAGAGFGSRMQLFRTLSGDVVVAFPLIDGEVSRVGDPRVQFSVRAGF